MTSRRSIRIALATALGSLMIATVALAGPKLTFGPENQGTLELQYKGQFQVIARDFGSGLAGDQNTYNFNFRRNRLALMGTYGEKVTFYVQSEFTEDPTVTTLSVLPAEPGSNFQLLDAVVRFNLRDDFRVHVGKFKYNFSRENLAAGENPLTLDRSLFARAPYVTTRDMGVGVWGNLLRDRVQYRVDMMEGRKAVASPVVPKSNFRYSARGHVTLFEPESEYGYKGTYVGTKKVLTLGGAVQYEPNVAWADPTQMTEVKSYTGWTVDGMLEYPFPKFGTATLGMAYEKVDFDDSYLALHPDLGTVGLDGAKNGGYVKAAYLLPKMPLQVFGRYERWRFAMLDNVYDQRIDWTAGGVNYYVWGQNLKLTAEVSNTRFLHQGTFDGLQGSGLTSHDFNTVVGQLQVIF